MYRFKEASILIFLMVCMLFCSSSHAEALSLTESTYNAITNLTAKDCRYNLAREYSYKDFKFLPEESKYIDGLNSNGKVHPRAFYLKLADYVNNFEMYSPNLYYASVILGYEPESPEVFQKHIVDFSSFFVDSHAATYIIKNFQKLSSVNVSNTGTTFSILIKNTKACASEMNVSEETLGYIMGALKDSGALITFNGSSCYISYVDYLGDFSSSKPTLKPQKPAKYEKHYNQGMPFTSDDFKYRYAAKTCDFWNDDDRLITWYCYDTVGNTISKDKHGNFTTIRGIKMLDSLQDVQIAYGDQKAKPIGKTKNVLYHFVKDSNAKHIEILNRCTSYLSYIYNDTAQLIFLFDKNNLLIFVAYCYWNVDMDSIYVQFTSNSTIYLRDKNGSAHRSAEKGYEFFITGYDSSCDMFSAIWTDNLGKYKGYVKGSGLNIPRNELIDFFK